MQETDRSHPRHLTESFRGLVMPIYYIMLEIAQDQGYQFTLSSEYLFHILTKTRNIFFFLYFLEML